MCCSSTPPGRLQNKAELMDELDKIVRVMRKVDAAAPHAVLLVLDATVGQNALSQVDAFQKTAGVTGLVMTKLDGTARGGILVAIAAKFALPVHFIGVGEGVDDLAPFTARDFARRSRGSRESCIARVDGIRREHETPLSRGHIRRSTKNHFIPLFKLALDLGPLIVFFAANREGRHVCRDRRVHGRDLIALVVSYVLVRHVPMMAIVSAVIVVVFGGATLVLHDETFIKLKPTIIYSLFA